MQQCTQVCWFSCLLMVSWSFPWDFLIVKIYDATISCLLMVSWCFLCHLFCIPIVNMYDATNHMIFLPVNGELVFSLRQFKLKDFLLFSITAAHLLSKTCQLSTKLSSLKNFLLFKTFFSSPFTAAHLFSKKATSFNKTFSELLLRLPPLLTHLRSRSSFGSFLWTGKC